RIRALRFTVDLLPVAVMVVLYYFQFFLYQFGDPAGGFREYFSQVYFLRMPQQVPEGSHENIINFGGQVHLADPPRNGFPELRRRDARAAVQDQGYRDRGMDPGKQVELQLRLLFVEAVGGADGHGQRVDPRFLHEGPGFLRLREMLEGMR